MADTTGPKVYKVTKRVVIEYTYYISDVANRGEAEAVAVDMGESGAGEVYNVSETFRVQVVAPSRLGHCTTLNSHNPLCDRDGHYCSLESTHRGACKPHGTAAK